jgi:hypothetical protein
MQSKTGAELGEQQKQRRKYQKIKTKISGIGKHQTQKCCDY